ncbi:MAG: dipeptide epimerase [Fretibacterium sp.]|nr:dipeptide epimerase [Fretibacterium sp.]
MKITRYRLGTLAIPLKKPFKTALRSTSVVTTNIFELGTDEGLVGYGEAPPTAAITGDTDGSIVCTLATRIAPALLGREVADLQDSLSAVAQSAVGNHSAKAAADIALHDLWGKAYGQPLYRLWGGSPRTFETDYTISLNPLDEMARDAAEAVQEGYSALKIKVGVDFRLDMQRMAAVRSAVGSDVLLRVDANQGWTAKEAVRTIRRMEDEGLDVELVEQPVPAHDLEGLKLVTDSVSTLILADESLCSARDAQRLIALRAADLLNIKLMKSGGLAEALRICAAAEAAGMECMIGAMMESKISVSAAAHLALARRVITRFDLDPPILCAHDPVEGGVSYDGAVLSLNDAPGLGIKDIEGVEWSVSQGSCSLSS